LHSASVLKKGQNSYAIIQDSNNQTKVVFDLGEKKIRTLFWSSHQHLAVVSSVATHYTDTGDLLARGEHYIVHVYSITTGTETILFHDTPGFTTSITGNVQRIRIGGQYQITASGYGNKGLSLRVFDLDTGKSTEMDLGKPGTVNWLVTPDGALVARAIFDSNKKVWSLEMRVNHRWKEVFNQTEAIDFPTLAGLGRSNQTVIIGIWAGENAGRYFEIGADGILSPPLNIADDNLVPLFDPVSQRFGGFARVDDSVVYQYELPQLQKLADLCKATLPEQRVTICEFAAEDPRQVLLFAESVDDPGTYYVVNFSAGTSLSVGATYPNLPTPWIAERKPITYKAADGLEIHGYLTLPPVGFEVPTGKPLPLIVLPHGGPQARDTLSFNWQSQLYASHGYAVLQPNFRGSTGYGTAFMQAGYGEWGRKMQTDLSDGVRYLARTGLIDPQRVAIVGASYGGYAALAAATLDQNVYRCAVAIAAVSNPIDMINAGLSSGFYSTASMYWKRFMGAPETLDAISPYKQAKRCTIPVLMFHGLDDSVVYIGQSRKMRDALKAAGKDVTLIEQKGEDHWETNEAQRLEMSRAIMAFLENHNPPIL